LLKLSRLESLRGPPVAFSARSSSPARRPPSRMPYSSNALLTVFAVAVVAIVADAELAALRGTQGDTPDVAALGMRALSGEDAHHEGNKCEGKVDGWRCKGDYAVQCRGGRTVSHEKCAFHQECDEGLEAGLATASCKEDACEDKVDGLHCKGDHVVQCAGLRTVNFTKCAFYQECKRDRGQLNARCAEDVCDDEVDGSHCKDGHVVQCQGKVTVKATKCAITEECKSHALGVNAAACQEDDCSKRADGSYCEHGGVVQCKGGRSVKFSKCPFFQECKKSHSEVHTAACQEDACDDNADGWRCKHDHLVRCASQQTTDVVMCASFQECDDKGIAPACM